MDQKHEHVYEWQHDSSNTVRRDLYVHELPYP